jgi:3-oxoacyl-[acyl-carrier protein] reductase
MEGILTWCRRQIPSGWPCRAGDGSQQRPWPGHSRRTRSGRSRRGAPRSQRARPGEDRAICGATGHQSLAIPVDLSHANGIIDAVAAAASRFGRIDVVVNAAATDVPGPAVDLTIDAWDRVIAVNLRAPFLLARAVFPHMRRVGGETIVNVSSVAGKRGWANVSAYCASKFRLTGLTQSLAAEGKPTRSGYVMSIRAGWPSIGACVGGAPNYLAPLERSTALPPDDVASLIVWIAAAPREVVLNEAIITPIAEQGWL